MLEPAMVKPVQGGLVEKLVLDDRERRNSVGQRILFVQALPDGYDLVPLPCELPTELTEQAAAFFPDTDEIRAARAHKPSQYEVRVIWHDDPGTVTLYV